MDTLKKAGAMLAHLDLFHSMLDLRRLLQLAAHMRERGDRAMLVSEGEITLIGGDTLSAPEIVTARGETIDALTAHRVLQSLKGYSSSEYAVNHEELAALNARGIAVRLGRCPATGPGAAEPGGQCHQVHRPGLGRGTGASGRRALRAVGGR